MAISGRRFNEVDESDWIFSTSASCLDGSTTASRILQELFKGHCGNMPTKTPRKKPKSITASLENIPKQDTDRTDKSTPLTDKNENFIVKKIPGGWSFEDFDESQHLNGCPMKWLYHKKMMEKNKRYKIVKPCNKKTVKKTEVKREKAKNLRDKTPIEVKIHKINLIEKYTSNCDEFFSSYPSFPLMKPRGDSKDLETHRKKLAAKLNWKLHDDNQDDSSLETSSEVNSRHNYFPPRPLLGLKPLLSVLLTPHQDSNCCTLVALKNATPTQTKMEASLSIQSLDLPFPMPESKCRPRVTNPSRWGSKSSSHAKKLQIPNPITIKLEEKKKKSGNQVKVGYAGSPMKKISDRTKQSKSLSSLFYELRGKTNYRNENERYFEEMIRDLTMDEGEFKIRRFFNMNSPGSDLVQGWRNRPEKRKKLMKGASVDSEMNLVCGKVRFFQKKSSRSVKREENDEENVRHSS